jgi:nicotinamidase-related amidase
MPQEEKIALVVVDVLSEYDHPDADLLRESVEEVLPTLAHLVEEARDRGVFTVYVNDTFADWTLDRTRLLDRVMAGPHKRLVEPLLPHDEVAFVLKGRHSIFWQTPLEFILNEAGVTRVVLCGQVTEQCILYSALDAHVRGFDITVVSDASAAIHPDLAEASLKLMELNMHARIATADEALDAAGVQVL